VFPYFVALAGVSVLSITISAVIIYRHCEGSTIAGAQVVVGAAFWLMMDALQLVSNSLSIKLFFYMMRFVGLVLVPSGWLLLALLISGYERYVKPRTIVALSIVPLLTLLLDFTNQSHGLMWINATLNPADPYLPISITSGPGFWILVVSYSYALVLVGLIIFVRRINASRRAYRTVALQMLLVSAVPWALNVAYVINRSLFPYFEPSSLAITVTGVLLLWRLVYLPLVNVVPVAHEILVDSLDEGIIVLDALNRIVDANPKAQNLFGHSLSWAGGKPIEAVWAEWPVISKALDSETGKEATLGNGGEQRIYEVKGSKIEGLLANVPYQLVTLRDITEHKHMEDELRRYSERLEELVAERTRKLMESETRFRQLADLLPQPVLELDNQGKFTFANRAAFALTGYTEEDMRRGINALDLVVTEDQQRLAKTMMRIAAGEDEPGHEYTVVRKDGSTFPVFMQAAQVMRGSEFVGFRAIAVDISERKRMEESLRESEERLKTIFDSVRTCIMIIDPKKHVIVDANPDAIEMMGAPKDKIVGSVCHKFVCPAQEGRCPITDLGQTIDHAERVLVRANGKPTPVMKSVRRIVLSGQEHLLESFIDITERKKLEAELAESQRLASIGSTTAMVGHDLRNPLQALAGMVYLLKNHYEGIPTEHKKTTEFDATKTLHMMEASIGYMNKIVSDLQNYAAPLQPQPAKVSTHQLLKEILSTTAIPPRVKVSVTVEKGSETLNADPDLIKRVFMNLTVNAVQAMPQGGELKITAQNNGEEELISFQDTGVGISRETLPKLFEPLFTTKAQGQGLGLAVCKRVMEAHGGTITVDSTIGKGSTFTARLPIPRNMQTEPLPVQ